MTTSYSLCDKITYVNQTLQGIQLQSLKGHGNEADFLGFLQKLVPHESLTIPFGPFRFWLRIHGDIRIWKTTPCYHRYGESPTPRIIELGSRRLPQHWYAESPTPCITDTESRLLNFLKENSLYRWYGESESRRLRVSPIWRVDDSEYRWVQESMTPRIGDTESLFKEKINLVSIFRTFIG
jgi:hypothetical protein